MEDLVDRGRADVVAAGHLPHGPLAAGVVVGDLSGHHRGRVRILWSRIGHGNLTTGHHGTDRPNPTTLVNTGFLGQGTTGHYRLRTVRIPGGAQAGPLSGRAPTSAAPFDR
jgi:hypothetical protein